MDMFSNYSDDTFIEYLYMLLNGIQHEMVGFDDLENDDLEEEEDEEDDTDLLPSVNSEQVYIEEPSDLVEIYYSGSIVHLNSNTLKSLNKYIYETLSMRGIMFRLITRSKKDSETPKGMDKKYYVRLNIYGKIPFNISEN